MVHQPTTACQHVFPGFPCHGLNLSSSFPRDGVTKRYLSEQSTHPFMGLPTLAFRLAPVFAPCLLGRRPTEKVSAPLSALHCTLLLCPRPPLSDHTSRTPIHHDTAPFINSQGARGSSKLRREIACMLAGCSCNQPRYALLLRVCLLREK
jgi:hypothetical protein